ncbi:MAG TPA: protein phosphatase 2C domain-containing protein [Oligoflexia bacterium]|nr:protein phosphatase 2C domain-containing protein [Oligoflexia bacterium]HMP48376.1 protein phosphatase 2C domain-containing protein [Oligoflexia bacterium]
MTFKVKGTSVPGTAHLGQGPVLIGKNNQDAFIIQEGREGGNPLICLVSDGVSSACDAEVGSKLAVRLYHRTIQREFRRAHAVLNAAVQQGLKIETDPLPGAFWARVDNNALAPLSSLMMALGPDDESFRQTLRELFIFTVIGILHTEEYGSWVFGPKGSDGVYAVNEDIVVLEPQTGNKPISPCYRFVPNEFQDQPDLMETVVHRYIPPGKLENFLIGTDGMVHYMSAIGKKMPGRNELVLELSKLWVDDEFFRDDSLHLYFRQMNTQSCRLIRPTTEEEQQGKKAKLLREPGLLMDDTTLVIGKRFSTL